MPLAAIKSSSSLLAHCAVEALLDELRLTPKPALVDQHGSGAHLDLNFALMQRSAHSLAACFQAISETTRQIGAVNQELREALGDIGREGEARMLEVTGGINTHRGAIWNLGLLLAAAELDNRNADTLTDTAAHIARIPDRFAPISASHGMIACQRYHAGGARAQATHGFPHVHIALAELRHQRTQGICETHARLDALLRIMTTLDDTCVLHRAGQPGLQAMQTGAAAVLNAGGSSTLEGRRALKHLEHHLLHLNASPGGAADILAAALFVERVLPFPRNQHESAEI